MRSSTRAFLVGAFALTLTATSCNKVNEMLGFEEPSEEAGSSGEAQVDELVKLAESIPDEAEKLPGSENLQLMGKFTTNAAMPATDGGWEDFKVDEPAIAELNVVARWRAETAFSQRRFKPDETVIVQLGGGGNDGLQINVRARGKTAAHKVVPANNGPELVTNFDHSFGKALDELGFKRK